MGTIQTRLCEWSGDYDGYCVYSLEFPNGKLYIGKTNNIIRRMNEHREDAKTYNTLLYKAIRKYSWNTIKFDLVEIK